MNSLRVLMAIGVSLLSAFCHAEGANKRLPLGFQGMRGKKSLDLTALDDNFNTLSDQDKALFASQQEPMSLPRIQQYWNGLPDHYSAYKRAPMGFQGMRGKKDDFDTGPLYKNLFADEYMDYENAEKRALKGFQGMRGKKQYEFPMYSYMNKRKSMGFQGMRGKKDDFEEPMGLYEPNNELDNYLATLARFYPKQPSDLDYLDGDAMDKRGLKGFQGMRGKREFDNFDMAEDKRAPSGFMGMRGKKDGNDNVEHNGESDQSENNLVQSKNEGMKEVVETTILPTANVNEQISGLDVFGNGDATDTNSMLTSIKERRSPNYGFYGVRGKKMPFFTSLFGTRGKKGPYDYPFRGKFVGVRGKKSDHMQQLEDQLSWSGDNYQKRRGPSGFVGMRGKKSISPDDVFETHDGAEN